MKTNIFFHFFLWSVLNPKSVAWGLGGHAHRDYFKLAHGVWGYCEGCVLFTVWLIPFEEYCFFVLQTVITTLWSVLVFYPKLPLLCFLDKQGSYSTSSLATILPIVFFAAVGLFGWHISVPGTPTFYLGRRDNARG